MKFDKMFDTHRYRSNTAMKTNITTEAGRKRLAARQTPYWHTLEKGRAIGYRPAPIRGSPGCAWQTTTSGRRSKGQNSALPIRATST
jgi:hypothetical protein